MFGARYSRFAYPISVAFCALGFSLFGLPIWAQHGGGSAGGSHGIGGGGGAINRALFSPVEPGTNPNPEAGVIVPTTPATQKPVVNQDETCLPWVLPVAQTASVSVASLGVSGKARSQYDKACDAFEKKKLTEAEQHARDA